MFRSIYFGAKILKWKRFHLVILKWKFVFQILNIFFTNHNIRCLCLFIFTKKQDISQYEKGSISVLAIRYRWKRFYPKADEGQDVITQITDVILASYIIFGTSKMLLINSAKFHGIITSSLEDKGLCLLVVKFDPNPVEKKA